MIDERPDAAGRGPRRKRGTVRLVVSLVVAALLLAGVFWLADLDDLLDRLRGADLRLVAASALAYLVTYVARAGRFAAAGAKASIGTLFFVVSVHGAMNRVMPLRTGELAYPLIVRRIGAAGLEEGLVQLLMLRILDLLTIVLLFVGALAGSAVAGVETFAGPAGGSAVIAVTVVIGAVAAVVLWRLGWFLRLGLGLARRVAAALRLARDGGKLDRTLSRAEDAVRSVTDLSFARRLALGGWSFLCWGAYFALFHLILAFLGVEMHPLRTVLGSSAAIVGSVVPVSGLGTFGALEGGWTAGFVAIGMDASTAASTGILMSGLTLLFALALGAVGWIALGLRAAPDRAR